MKPWVPSPPEVSIDPRRASRVEISVYGEFVTAGGSAPCIIEDISPTGARLIGSVGASRGDVGILRCRELDVLSEVRWKTKSETGLSFAEPILEIPDDHTDGEDLSFEEAERRANNRRFFRLIWTMA